MAIPRIQFDGFSMDARIRVILKIDRSRYAVTIAGEEIGVFETLSDAASVRDFIREQNWTIDQVRAILATK